MWRADEDAEVSAGGVGPKKSLECVEKWTLVEARKVFRDRSRIPAVFIGPLKKVDLAKVNMNNVSKKIAGIIE